MIAAWMLFAVAFGVALGAAATAVEPVLAASGRSRRVPWAIAMLLATLWPAAAVLAALTIAPARLAPVVVSPLEGPVARAGAFVANALGPPIAGGVDRLLLAAWGVATLVLVVRLVAARRRLGRERDRWRRDLVDGAAVRISEGVGPALVGLRTMEIVLPPWTLALDQSLRALVLRHEEEHRAARDPYLLFAAALAVALVPWNAALWWHARRLRLAIEMDCDARVLRSHPDQQRYGLLLLAIAQRSSATPLLTPALSEPPSDLERRIVAISTNIARPRLVAACVGAALALAVACALPAPTGEPTYREFQLTKRATPLPDNQGPRYPDELREAGVEGEVLLQFVVEASGRVDTSSVKVLRSTDPRFTEATRAMLAQWRFSPAEVNGRQVRQQIQMPFQFRLGPPPPPTR